MIDPETEFKRELVVFGHEVEEAIHSFYAARTIHTVAEKSRKTFMCLNKHAAFWNLATHALESNSLIVLGRIFDKDPRSHRIDRLLRIAADHRVMFSRQALRKRKREQNPNADERLDGFMRDVYVPTSRDFKRLEHHIDKRRKIFENNYMPLRHKVLAHKDRLNPGGLFVKTSTRELEKLLVFLDRLHQALWHMFYNGMRPILAPARHSTRRILDLAPEARRGLREAEWIIGETDNLLRSLAQTAT